MAKYNLMSTRHEKHIFMVPTRTEREERERKKRKRVIEGHFEIRNMPEHGLTPSLTKLCW